VREWLINQGSGGYVEYDAAAGRFHLSPEQRVALTDEESPFYVGGGFYVVKAMANATPRIADAFQNGGGMLWGEHDPDLFVGTERFFRPGYRAHLVNEWIPALTGIEEKLKAGALMADMGCGHGASTIIMAQAYPASRFRGFDNHEPSVEAARGRAEEAGVADRLTFEVASSGEIPEGPYDLVCFFDCLHDMGDPAGAMRRTHEVLAEGGSALIVEPMAGDAVEENFNIIGRTFSAASTLCCTANSLAQNGPALGAVAPEKALARDSPRRGLLRVPARHTDALQPRLRGEAVRENDERGMLSVEWRGGRASSFITQHSALIISTRSASRASKGGLNGRDT
jgi:SAM-dependent methyltransferase